LDHQLSEAFEDLRENGHDNGYHIHKKAAVAPTKLWSAGMTASKTAKVNSKLMAIASDVARMQQNPQYGQWLNTEFMKLQANIGRDMEAFD
jgi:hypothetical protein